MVESGELADRFDGKSWRRPRSQRLLLDLELEPLGGWQCLSGGMSKGYGEGPGVLL